ncbi:MAG: bifunctional UDP-N-acetylglucosamine diphosphorylase/glucosamine-1-phosphate N-acetyltransferase GlmU [Coriobacteriia bacterium]
MGTTALILAAGEGTRMKSALPKVAHRILGLPMVTHVVRATRAAGVERVVVVTGHGAHTVEALLADSGVEFVRQEEQHGTGHAVLCAEPLLRGHDGSLLVIAGDCPLFTPETLAALIAEREREGAAAVVLTTRLADPTGYGRIVRAGIGGITAIVEDRDLKPEQRRITEINTSTYCFDSHALFGHLRKLENANAQGEYYLTDMIGVLRGEGLTVGALEAADATETLGINSRVQLAEAARVLQRRINERHMLAGVTMTAPELVWIGPDVRLGRDVVIEPMTALMGSTTVGDDCLLGPGARITDATLGRRCIVDSSIIEGGVLADGATVGPYAHIRSDTDTGSDAPQGGGYGTL